MGGDKHKRYGIKITYRAGAGKPGKGNRTVTTSTFWFENEEDRAAYVKRHESNPQVKKIKMINRK
jgi:hypothetical protein